MNNGIYRYIHVVAYVMILIYIIRSEINIWHYKHQVSEVKVEYYLKGFVDGAIANNYKYPPIEKSEDGSLLISPRYRFVYTVEKKEEKKGK